MHEKRCLDLLEKSLSPLPQELNELDWKASTCKVERMAKHLSAFANYPGGGFLVYGVADRGNVVGLNAKESELFAGQVANWARDLTKPEVRLHVFSFEFKDKALLGVYIEEAFDKPVHKKNGALEDSYLRAGGQSRQMTREEIRQSMMSSRHQRFEETAASLPASLIEKWMPAFDVTEFLKRTQFQSSDSERLLEHLFAHKLVARIDKKYVPTNLAVLTCARDLSKLASYERYAVRIIEYADATKRQAKKDVTIQSGVSVSLDLIVKSIVESLPHSEIIQNATKLKTSVIPTVAIREFVINSIMHRDFSKTNSFVTVEIFSDRVEITNPGGLMPDLSIDRLIDHPSVCRNEVLSDFLRKLGLAEERGSGVDNALAAIELWGLPPVLFENHRDYFKVVLSMPKTFKDMSKEERMTATYQHTCLRKLTGQRATNSSLRERFKFSESETTKIGRLISDSVEAERIKLANPKSSRRDFYYLPYWA
jgi:ATP-dependent DNA helicase RecG